MKVVNRILKPSRVGGFKEDFTYLEPKKIKHMTDEMELPNQVD